MSSDSYTEITSGLTEGQEEIITATSIPTPPRHHHERARGTASGRGGIIIQGDGPSGRHSPSREVDGRPDMKDGSDWRQQAT